MHLSSALYPAFPTSHLSGIVPFGSTYSLTTWPLPQQDFWQHTPPTNSILLSQSEAPETPSVTAKSELKAFLFPKQLAPHPGYVNLSLDLQTEQLNIKNKPHALYWRETWRLLQTNAIFDAAKPLVRHVIRLSRQGRLPPLTLADVCHVLQLTRASTEYPGFHVEPKSPQDLISAGDLDAEFWESVSKYLGPALTDQAIFAVEFDLDVFPEEMQRRLNLVPNLEKVNAPMLDKVFKKIRWIQRDASGRKIQMYVLAPSVYQAMMDVLHPTRSFYCRYSTGYATPTVIVESQAEEELQVCLPWQDLPLDGFEDEVPIPSWFIDVHDRMFHVPLKINTDFEVLDATPAVYDALQNLPQRFHRRAGFEFAVNKMLVDGASPAHPGSITAPLFAYYMWLWIHIDLIDLDDKSDVYQKPIGRRRYALSEYFRKTPKWQNWTYDDRLHDYRQAETSKLLFYYDFAHHFSLNLMQSPKSNIVFGLINYFGASLIYIEEELTRRGVNVPDQTETDLGVIASWSVKNLF